MLIGGILLGLIAGLLLGGRLGNLADVRLRFLPLLFLAVIVRFGTETALVAGVDLVEALRLPLFVTAYGLLLVGLWANRHLPGMSLAFVGILGNAIAIVANGGFMPIWEPSLNAAGFRAEDVRGVFHVVLGPEIDAGFLLNAGPLGDVVPIPIPIIQNVASIGDLFLSAGLGFFLFATVLRTVVTEPETTTEPGRLRGLAGSIGLPRPGDAGGAMTSGVPTEAPERTITAATGLTRGLAEATALEPPMILSGPGTGLSSPALAPLPGLDGFETVATGQGATAQAGALTTAAPAIAIPRPTILDRARRHPYVRLALDPSFSALWAGQVISVFGDRVHLIAVSTLILSLTGGSALAVAFVFVATMVPSLLLSPIAGVYVDRWDPRQVMIVSDLLRAAAVLLIPIVAVISVPLVYPVILVFSSISVFFRPARVTVLPRLVREEDILPANSALWVGETLAELIGYPIAVVFVLAIGAALPLAFWFDAVTYIASAVLIATISIRSNPKPEAQEAGRKVLDDLKAGWTFLRQDTVLLGNTIQSALGQFGSGMFTGVTFVFAFAVVGGNRNLGTGVFGGIETAIGAGNLVGGFVLGLVAARMARGRLIAGGFIAYGACIALMGIVGNVPLIIGLAAGSGIANMIFIIPSQSLFQERVPNDILGRVVGFRFALVFGAITFAGAFGGVIAEVFSPQVAVVMAGLIPLAAGIGGLFVRAVREA